MRRLCPWIVALSLVTGCSDETETGDPASPCLPPNRGIDDRCVLPGESDEGCPAGTLGVEGGGCQPAGMTAEMCAEGFIHYGDVGCAPVLPAEPCPLGLMALPGETECRPVMPCGQGPWGDLPVDGATQYVDGSYASGNSNGSATQPWMTINEAYAAASPGALIAVAQGTYHEDLHISNKPVRLWGVCPERVEMVGTGAEFGTVVITTGASGTEVGGLALTGAATGMAFSGSQDLNIERVWIHDTADRGINTENTLGPTSARITGVLIEKGRQVGLTVSGGEITIEDSLIRDSQPLGGNYGSGVHFQRQPQSLDRATVMLRHSLIERSHTTGALLVGADVTIERTVIRETAPQPSDGDFGSGISAEANTVLVLSDSFIEHSFTAAINVLGSTVTIERSVGRASFPRPLDGLGGWGLFSALEATSLEPARVTVRHSLFEHNQLATMLIQGTEALIESTVIQDSLPLSTDDRWGRGISLEPDALTGVLAPVTVRGCVIRRSHDFGLLVASVPATIEATLIEATEPEIARAQFGDGLAVISAGGHATATITTSRIADSARAGLANFGGTASLENTAIACAAFALNGERYFDQDFAFDNRGGNGCGCPQMGEDCKVLSAGLVPPDAVSSDP